MAVSTVPALKGALKAALEARTGLHDVLIAWGWPRSPRPEMILLGDVPDCKQEPAAMRAGGHTREESYDLSVLIRVERKILDQTTVTQRAYAIAAEIESLLRSDVTVGGTVRVAQFGAGKLEEQASDEARVALLEVLIYCEARI